MKYYTNQRYCKFCGDLIQDKRKRSFCSYTCLFHLDKSIYGTQLTYDEARRIKHQITAEDLEKNREVKKEKALTKAMQILSKRRSTHDMLTGFDSYVGVSKNQHSNCILSEEEANQLGLEEVFQGGEFYWHPKKKSLYFKYKDKYLALTAEI